MFDWVDILESKLDSMSPVGTDLETVKQQIVELKVQSRISAEHVNSLLLFTVIEAQSYTSCVYVECLSHNRQ